MNSKISKSDFDETENIFSSYQNVQFKFFWLQIKPLINDLNTPASIFMLTNPIYIEGYTV